MKKKDNELTIKLGEGQAITPELLEEQFGVANAADYGDDLGEADEETEVIVKIG